MSAGRLCMHRTSAMPAMHVYLASCALAGSWGPDAGRPTIRPKFFFPQNLIRPTRGRQPLVLPGGTTQDITGPTRRRTYVRGVRLATCTSTTLCRLWCTAKPAGVLLRPPPPPSWHDVHGRTNERRPRGPRAHDDDYMMCYIKKIINQLSWIGQR